MNRNFYKINEVQQHKYYQAPKELFTNPRYKLTLNNDAKMLYAILLDRMELSRTNGWVEDDGTIYLIFKREGLSDILGLCETTVWRAMKQLKAVGLIGEKRQGLTKPNLIYIGKIDCSVPEETQDDTPDSNDENIKKTNDNTTPTTQTDSEPLNIKTQFISNLNANNTDYNNTEINNKLTKEIKVDSNNYINNS